MTSTPLDLPHLRTKRFGRPTYFYEELPSTQDLAKEIALSSKRDGTVVMANHQTAGRGREDRRWESLPGRQLQFSLHYRPTLDPKIFPIISVAAGVGVCLALESLRDAPFRVKWPNDVFIHGKKVCGLLPDVFRGRENHLEVVLGVGLNVSGTPRAFSKELADQVTTLESAGHTNISPIEVFEEILPALEETFLHLEQGRFRYIEEQFCRLNHFASTSIEINGLRGNIVGIGKDGSLRVRDTDDGLHQIRMGNILKSKPN